MVEQSGWVDLTIENPGHSTWYIERFRAMAEAGDDLVGEARLIDAMVSRTARILDAGCGPGRVGGHLASCGHEVVGVDVDPVLIAAAKHDHPEPRWITGDLAELDLPSLGISEGFDAIVSAGNVMTFLAPSTRRQVLSRLAAHLNESGRIITGFGAGRGYEFNDFFADVEASGLVVDIRLASWDLRPFADNSDFLVAVLSPSRDV